ncbi:MAG: hypothetical protein WAJ93_19695, partial [Candidatus Nitrosopolaris sp.]
GGGPASGGIGPGSNGPHHGIQRIDCNSNPKQCQIETTISSGTNGPGSNGEYEQYRIEIHRSLDIQLEGILRKW